MAAGVWLQGFILEVYRLSVRKLALMPEWILAFHLLITSNRSQKVLLLPYGYEIGGCIHQVQRNPPSDVAWRSSGWRSSRIRILTYS